MQSLRASHLCYPTSRFRKPYGLPGGNVHRGFAAELRWHRSVEREWNGAREVDMENHNAHADAATTLHGAIRRPLKTLRTWHRRARVRRQLSILDDRILADIGLSRIDVTKRFWQAWGRVEGSTELSDRSSTSRSRSRRSARS